MTSNIAVIGCGTWGVSLGSLLAWKGYRVRGWDVNANLLCQLDETRRHPKLPELDVPRSIEFSDDFAAVLQGAEALVVVAPSVAMRQVITQIKECPARAQNPFIIICSKGIEIETMMPMNEVAVDVLGPRFANSVGVLSGPSHAEEVSRRMPTSVVAASQDPGVAPYIQQLFLTPEFRVYTQTDALGVELGGALKNVIAIATGVCDGLGFGDNTRAALLTRGLAEMTRLGVAMGAQAATFSGLSGMGDLIVTATSQHSRNRKFGELLTRCSSVEEALEQVGMVVEGMPTARAVARLAAKLGIETPIAAEVEQVIYHGKSPKEAVYDLMNREAKAEIY
ncbi:NAD(P)-dependent glycerol-3-phosphate dehydrogenase [Candidatus Sumerlaeota bacterium]|nr:NAD(P)-dependent glycerol-3-phosphate dehydrogenase [Candidatus Sumerlaeota bacterium]